jgi:tetratricopeptide (TPR) repeat protein
MGLAEALVKIIFWPRVRKAKHIGHAAELIGQGRAEETLEILARMERRIPPYLGYLFFLTKARAFDELGRLEEAEQAYLAAVFAKQGANNAYLHLSVVCGRLGRLDEAREWLRRVREDAEAESELLEQADGLETLIGDLESGRRLEELHDRASRFAQEREVAGLNATEALQHLEQWAGEHPEQAREARDDLACLLGDLAVQALDGTWVVNLNLEDSYIQTGEARLNPFTWVSGRLSGEGSLERFPSPAR